MGVDTGAIAIESCCSCITGLRAVTTFLIKKVVLIGPLAQSCLLIEIHMDINYQRIESFCWHFTWLTLMSVRVLKLKKNMFCPNVRYFLSFNIQRNSQSNLKTTDYLCFITIESFPLHYNYGKQNKVGYSSSLMQNMKAFK